MKAIVLIVNGIIFKLSKEGLAMIPQLSMQHLRTEYLVRFLFFFFLAAVIATALVLAFHRRKQEHARPSSVDFSMMREAAARYKRELLFFGVLLLCIILIAMLFHATMFILLQIDLWQGLPIGESTGTFRQIADTLAGRFVMMNRSIFLDRERLFDANALGKGIYRVIYLRHSHLILQIQPIC